MEFGSNHFVCISGPDSDCLTLFQIKSTTQQKLVTNHVLHLTRSVRFLRSLSKDRLFVSYQSGDFDVFKLVNNELWYIKSEKQFEHDGEILTVEIRGNFIVTVGTDSSVKVW